MPAVAIVDDHQLLAETLRVALESAGVQAQIVLPAPVDDLASRLCGAPVDLVLLDLDLGPECRDATPLVDALIAAGKRVLIVTGSSDRLAIAAALERGAIGVQLKSAGFEQLVAATRAALTSTRPLDLEERVLLLDELYHARAARERELAPFRELTTREAETLRALAAGRCVADIAERWVVSETTVRAHVRAILSKLEVSSQLAAVVAAARSGWLTAGARQQQ